MYLYFDKKNESVAFNYLLEKLMCENLNFLSR